MTRTEQLELIRRKCVEANTDSGIMNKTYPGIQKRPLRLADVLLAIAENNFEGFQLNAVKSKQATDTCALWNLRQDDITLQSDECVAFLAELLKNG